MNNYFSQNLKYLREKSGMTQDELASKLGTTLGAISHWENGIREPNIGMIIKIAELFNVDESIILKDLRIKQNPINENEIEKNLKTYALDNGVELTINKHKELSAEDALKIQNEIQNILIDEIKKNKN